jgi:hypothetical protein
LLARNMARFINKYENVNINVKDNFPLVPLMLMLKKFEETTGVLITGLHRTPQRKIEIRLDL